MFLITGNGIKGKTFIQRLLSTQTFQFLRDADLCLSASLNSGTEPFQEFHECDAVFQHRIPKTQHLAFVLNGFHSFDRRLLPDNLPSYYII